MNIRVVKSWTELAGLKDRWDGLARLSPRQMLKRAIFALAWYSGLAWLYQRLTKNRRRILSYHSIASQPLANKILTITPKTFEEQMRYVKKLKAKGYKPGITFDDGYLDNYTEAFPVLQQLNLKATLFPTINYIEQGQIPGWDGEPDLPAVSYEQIRELLKSGVFTIGSHTITHPSLAQLTPEQITEELLNSKNTLEQELLPVTGRRLPVTSVAYPFGKPEQIGAQAKKIARELGFTHGYTLTEGTNGRGQDPLSLKRLVIFDEPMYMFKVRVSGILDDFLNLFRKI